MECLSHLGFLVDLHVGLFGFVEVLMMKKKCVDIVANISNLQNKHVHVCLHSTLLLIFITIYLISKYIL
jgi:hypothetical protein